MYSRTIIAGRLGRDPELHATQTGEPFVTFSVATTDRVPDKEAGGWKEATTWFDVAVFGGQCDPCKTYLAKGRSVLIEGRVSARAYKGSDGTPKASLSLRANRVQFLDRGDTPDKPGVVTAKPAGDEDYSGGVPF